MKSLVVSIAIFCLALFSLGCGSTDSASSAGVKRGIAPIADDEVAVIEFENSAAFGTITIELYSNIAPKMVERFKTLAKQGFYNGTTFHRVSPIVIQGGDPLSKDNEPRNDGTGKSQLPNVPAEFSDIPFERGIVGAARSQDVDSANCQFFITIQPYPAWTENYTAFGKVIDGMNNVDVIKGVPTAEGSERPADDVRIKSITFIKR
jgi:peptidyl-prolyl cis-trans isomerase B (cyclophilin B)